MTLDHSILTIKSSRFGMTMVFIGEAASEAILTLCTSATLKSPDQHATKSANNKLTKNNSKKEQYL